MKTATPETITYQDIKDARARKACMIDSWLGSPTRNDALRAGTLRHSLDNESYRQASFRGSYYAWAARKGFVVTGGDPWDGRPAKVREYDGVARAEGRVVHMAQAKFWYARAAAIRERMKGVLP